MHQAREIINGGDLTEMRTIQEMSTLLGVSYSRAAAIIQQHSLAYRYASKEEEDSLFQQHRILGLPATAPPGQRVKLIPLDIVESVRARKKRGWPKGVSRTPKGEK